MIPLIQQLDTLLLSYEYLMTVPSRLRTTKTTASLSSIQETYSENETWILGTAMSGPPYAKLSILYKMKESETPFM